MTTTSTSPRSALRTPAGSADSHIRIAGWTLAAGSTAWAITLCLFGSVGGGALGAQIGDLGGLAFQIGVFALLAVQQRSRVLGDGRFWGVAFTVEKVLLVLAAIWSLLHAFWPDLPFLPVLDAFWPLSMVGMFVIGVAILIRGRWRGALRIWPAIAESWAIVCVPALAIFGDSISYWLPAVHLGIGYIALGVILALRPDLTRPSRF